MFEKKKYYLIGIGGAGMSAIAEILHHQGHKVSGSDRSESEVTKRLKSIGIEVFIGHKAENIGDIDILVYSAAIPVDNPEMQEAAKRGIPALERPEMLGRLMDPFKHRIGVSGVHGKTTTTTMIDAILHHAGLDITSLIGADVLSMGSNARLGSGDIALTEACEAFGSFLHLRPSIAVITNIEPDHLDFYGTVENVEKAFLGFAGNVDADGCVICNGDDDRAKKIAGLSGKRIVSFGFSQDCDVNALNADLKSPKASFDLVYKGKNLGRISLTTTGAHNIMNALAASSAVLELGVDFSHIKFALEALKGAQRRFEVLFDNGKIMVVDDYAHHPTELRSTLTSAKNAYDKRIVAVFQPHLYSRTKFFEEEFADALSIADEVVVNAIYAAREKPIDGVSGENLIKKLHSKGFQNAKYIADKQDVIVYLLETLKENDMALVLGAGDIRMVSENLAKAYKDGCPDYMKVANPPVVATTSPFSKGDKDGNRKNNSHQQ